MTVPPTTTTTPAPTLPPAATPAPETPTQPPAAEPAAQPEKPAAPAPEASPAQPDKPAEPAEPEKPAAAELEITTPEGVALDEDLLSGFKAWAAAAGLDSAKAQGVVDLVAQRAQAIEEALGAAHKAEVAEWQKATTPEERTATERALQRFSPDGEALKLLDAAGLRDHPALVRMLSAVQRMISEDSIAGAGGTDRPSTQAERLARFYDKSSTR